MKKIIFLMIFVLTFFACSIENKSAKNILQNQAIQDYNENLKLASNISLNLMNYANNLNFSKNNRVNKEEIVANYFNENSIELDNMISEYLGYTVTIEYSPGFMNTEIERGQIDNLPLTDIEKHYYHELYTYAVNEDLYGILSLVESYKLDLEKHPELSSLGFTFAIIENYTNEFLIDLNKEDAGDESGESGEADCQSAAETGGVLGGAWGMIKGAISGGFTGTVLGMNPGTGAVGAVAGSVAGGLTGYVEGALLGYIGCEIYNGFQ
ncbi:hypothetical protein CLV86_0734 [Lacinutrix venerupis]|uniref:DUF1269 domain-containing protein n=1 Tax=Lacinutrix venerupis TaxID=1486034 RepID=UPI000EAE460F|nr:DUF1269 domain-containing protein [Lacinutrix venerupis]RLJ67241.1 hypothetical protein CLV86_0734 [Lacinutrix venerupis]